MWLSQAAGLNGVCGWQAATQPLGADQVTIPAFLDLFRLNPHPELCLENPRKSPADVLIMEASGSTGTVRAFRDGLVLKSP